MPIAENAFFLVPDARPPRADFGVPPEGATLIDLSIEAPFADLRLTVGALEEGQRLHLRWRRWQDGRWRLNLDGANLARANLDGANLDGANLADVRDDIYEVLSHAPDEAPALLAAIREGKVDGTVYRGACACLVGTIANARGIDVDALGAIGIPMNSERPAERWFLAIQKDQTPTTNPIAAITARWIEEWIAARPVTQAAPAEGAAPGNGDLTF